MRLLLVTACSATLLAASSAARADDTKPPAIDRVSATQHDSRVVIEARIADETGVLSATVHYREKGGAFRTTAMTKNDFDDVFKASFAGGPETEYWIEAIDLLGNGPATFGAQSKPLAVRVVKSAPPAHAHAPKKRPAAKVASSAPAKPVIEHKKPADPVEGRDVPIRATIRSAAPIALSGVYYRKTGESGYSGVITLRRVHGDEFEGIIPGEKAHGSIEYLIAAKDAKGQQTNQGDGNSSTWFGVTFKAAPRAPQPYSFAVNPPVRIAPGQPVTLRAQITAVRDDAYEPPAKAQVLWRGGDGQESQVEMQGDPNGGIGGFKAVLPALKDGALYYQIVACDSSGAKCAVDTGGRRTWHAVSVTADPAKPTPAPLDVASKAPASLPE
jgi:hypothetical protein